MTIREAVKKSGTRVFLFGGAIKQAQKVIMPKEDVLFAATVNVGYQPITQNLKVNTWSLKIRSAGVIVITTHRVMFSSSALGNSGIRVIQLQNIQSYDDKKEALIGAAFRIIGNTEMFVVDCRKRLLPVMREAMQSALSHSQTHTLPVQPVSDADELLKFKKLLDADAITQEEFDRKKRQLLGA